VGYSYNKKVSKIVIVILSFSFSTPFSAFWSLNVCFLFLVFYSHVSEIEDVIRKGISDADSECRATVRRYLDYLLFCIVLSFNSLIHNYFVFIFHQDFLGLP
jgi:hypothetical protein